MLSIYALCEQDGTIRYIGKTSVPLRARWQAHRAEATMEARSHTPKARWLVKRLREGEHPRIELLMKVPDSEWQLWERSWIAVMREIGGPRLLNVKDGGEAHPSGYVHVHTPEQRDKISAAIRTRIQREKDAGTYRCPLVGRKMSLEQRSMLSELKTDVPWNGKHGDDFKQNLAERNRARLWTPEMRARRSATHKATLARKRGDAQ